jgi:predicted RNA-binding Zn ribbon-like protein
MLVSMRWSEKFGVQRDIALLYDFANSLDLRRYVEHGAAHDPGDELAMPRQLEDWLRVRGLLKKGAQVSPAEHLEALQLRDALRTFLAAAPAHRTSSLARLAAAAARFPLEIAPSRDRALDLRPVPGRATSGLGLVLAQLLRLSDSGTLERVKTCDSDECRWVFYDRSKPSNRRWCSSALCGNREKTRIYRRRHAVVPR